MWKEKASNPQNLRGYTKSDIKTLTEIIHELETDITPPVLPKLHSDIYSAIEYAENTRMRIDQLEDEAMLRTWSEAWIVEGPAIYDSSNGRIGSVEGMKAARYLESRAENASGAKRVMYLRQARLIERLADKLYDEREQIHISPPL